MQDHRERIGYFLQDEILAEQSKSGGGSTMHVMIRTMGGKKNKRKRDNFVTESQTLPFPLSTSSLRCVCVARSLSRGSSCSAGERKHTLGARYCHIMSLFGL